MNTKVKSARGPLLLLFLLACAFLALLAASAPLLPERVATHFGADGQPNGWMTRSAHLLFTGGFGLSFPLLFSGLCFCLRHFPPRLINIPHRDYWFAPGRRAESCAFLFRHSLWLSCLWLLFVAAVSLQILEANRTNHACLSPTFVLALTATFITGLGGWILLLFRRFYNVPPAEPTADAP